MEAPEHVPAMGMNVRHDSSSRDTPRRTDPTLGDLDQLDAGADRRGPAREREPERPASASRTPPYNTRPTRKRPLRRRRRVRWSLIVLAVVVVGVIGWLWSHQAMLSGMLPQTQLNALLARADTAYSAGNLAGGPESARDLYEAARALDPDNEHALTGLQNVGHAELDRAQAALKKRDYAAARSALEEARSLLGGGAAVEGMDKALAKAVLQTSNVDVLINQARAALANGDIGGPDGAAALFGKVLAGDPHNAVARHGMDQIGDLLATRIQGQLGGNDLAGARQTLSNLAGLLPRYSQLPTLRASVAAAERDSDSQRDQYLDKGQAYLRAGKVTGTGDDNAEAQFKAALKVDPDNDKAKAGLGQVAGALIVQANAAMESGQVQDAKKLLDAAAELAPKSADLAAARSRLAASETRQEPGPAHRANGNGSVATAGADQAPEASAPPPPAPLTPMQSAKVARLVARARSAARKGDIMLPPGDSAYDLYRAALGIDGDNDEAQAGLRGLPEVTRAQFDQAVREDNLDHAHDMLATLEQLDPGDPAMPTMRHRLGSAWLDRADHYVGLGELAAARTALQEAQRLVPQDPRIGEVDARIQRGNR
jgi:tetratricopeptide (TPR) repeat protein